ncbi:BRCA1-associated protein-like [Paramacrobiotus metropolitanus]|uniref:BRCA1-associated protein-like n=1 Tax=Paramacrobiotus metropolitanus TaxID=2943436 RepID=UPI002445EE35|nr:BRCA1-associated protein-like [Paramacrobiotus metropolitanus]
MSVCLAYIRLELELHGKKPSDFDFAVSRPFPQGTDPDFFYNSKEEFLSALQILRGKRAFREYTIETYNPVAAQLSMDDIPPHERLRNRSRTTSTAKSESSESASGEIVQNDEFLVNFYYGNPSVEMVKGILHLYRDNERTSLKPGIARSTLLCMLSVPAHLSIRDLLAFTASFSPEIERLRIIRDQAPSQYMVLLRFKNQEAADRFYDHFNGVPFNSIEADICRLAYVGKVDAVEDIEGGGMRPYPGTTELPTCTVCLDKMDEGSTGILTILCNHSFHGACLQQWGDTSCPVCRYFQTPQASEEQTCVQCGMVSDDLWLCLICGHVGCGRYSGKHAEAHFKETQHTYALNIKTQRVWDYFGDGYVHRLIQGQSADKMVEMEDGSGNMDEKMESITLEYSFLLNAQLESQRHYYESKMRKQKEAIEALKRELTSREAENDNLAAVSAEKRRFEIQVKQHALTIDNLRKEKLELEERLRHYKKQNDDLLRQVDTVQTNQEDFQTVTKEKEALEKKLNQLTAQLVKVTKELNNEQQLSKGLMENQKEIQVLLEIISQKDREKSDLQEQLADLMFHMQAQQKISEMPDEIRGEIEEGNTMVGDRQIPRTARNRRRRP